MLKLLSRNPFFFFNDTATTEIYTLSLHDALPIFLMFEKRFLAPVATMLAIMRVVSNMNSSTDGFSPTSNVCIALDRKSTRLNSSHQIISYAVFCLKKKNNINTALRLTSISDTETK